MPELPEVETVKLDLEKAIFGDGILKNSKSSKSKRISAIALHSPKIRNVVPINSIKKLIGSQLLKFERRGKYLFFHTNKGSIINHLGMTGCWRVEVGPSGALKKHDHFELVLDGEFRMIYNDIRRFGVLDFTDQKDPLHSVWTQKLGPEPLSSTLNVGVLYRNLINKKSDIKTVLLDQTFLAGIGNIYASEVLFESKVHPQRKAHTILRKEFKKILTSTKRILAEAIVAGGSTIRDYKQLNGQSGLYANSFKVYGRDGKPCEVCKNKITKKVQMGRSTYFCEKCQPLS